MLDSTAAVAAERQGKNARQLLESVALTAGDDDIAISVVTVMELAQVSPALIRLNAEIIVNGSWTSCSQVFPSNQ